MLSRNDSQLVVHGIQGWEDLLDLDGLHLQIVIESLQAALSAVSRLFYTTERGIRRGEIPVVDRDCSCFNLPGDPECSADGTCVDAGLTTL